MESTVFIFEPVAMMIEFKLQNMLLRRKALLLTVTQGLLVYGHLLGSCAMRSTSMDTCMKNVKCSQSCAIVV